MSSFVNDKKKFFIKPTNLDTRSLFIGGNYLMKSRNLNDAIHIAIIAQCTYLSIVLDSKCVF